MTSSELDYMVDAIVAKLDSKQTSKLNKTSIKILYASLVDESEIETQPVLLHPENTPVKDEVSIHVGSQMFGSSVEPSGVPKLLDPLLQERLIEKISPTVYKITFKGIKFCEEEFDMYDKYSLIKCKCMNCSLHFIICTWHPETHTRESITCPECGNKKGNFIKWRETVFGFIFELVPGNANIDM
jgi:DNA-directed RNA polymerase subunit RPC12/RpoP